MRHEFDVIVVGGGNAALSAALSAHEHGARVAVLDASPHEERGGNSRFAGAIFRIAHEGLPSLTPLLCEDALADLPRVTCRPYTSDDYRNDLMATSEGRADPAVVQLLIEQGLDIAKWLASKGVRWELNVGKYFSRDAAGDARLDLMPGASLRVAEEGVGLMAALYRAAEDARITLVHESPAHDLIVQGDAVTGVRVRTVDQYVDYYGQVVLACGGFEASPMMRRRYLGEGWDLVKVRGTRFNTGRMLEKAIAAGAQAYGHWGGCHSSPQDMDAPSVGDLEMHNEMSRYSYPFSICVNKSGVRFMDEGEDSFQYTYAKTGAAIRKQPGAIAYQVFDQKTLHLLEPRYKAARQISGETLDELAKNMDINAMAFRATVQAFNAACPASQGFDPFHNDGLATEGILPRKSNWALPIDSPPFVAFGVTCGITFTYGGLRTDLAARVINDEGHPMPGLYAAGEIVGGLFFHNYPGGAGLPRGAIFGRIAGREAANAARSTRPASSAA